MTSRRPTTPGASVWRTLPGLAIVVAYAVLVGMTFRDYGITWDERIQAEYGDDIVSWYASGFRDHGALDLYNLKYYGGFFDLIAQLTARVSPIGVFETRHLINALFGGLVLIGVWRLGTRLSSPAAGLLAMAFLLLTPGFYGHIYNNSKDIPFAALFAVSLYYIIVATEALPTIPRGVIVKLGIAIGLTLAVRIGGLVLLGYLLAAIMLWWLTRDRNAPTGFAPKGSSKPARFETAPEKMGPPQRERLNSIEEWSTTARPEEPPSSGGVSKGARWQFVCKAAPTHRARTGRPLWKPLATAYVQVCVVAYVTMLPWWPAAQAEPVLGPAKAFWKMTQDASYGRSKVFFEGVLLPATELPRRYLPEWILMTLPEFYFIGIAVCVVLGIRMARRSRWSAVAARRVIPHVLLATATVLPVLYAFARRPIMYDGMRHYLFIVPPLAVLVALGCVSWLTGPEAKPFKIIVLGALLGSMGLTAAEMARLHPYEYVFFNRAVGGGLADAAQSFETDYWGLSYKEGAEWIAAHYPRRNGPRLKVGSCSPPISTEYFLAPDQFEYVGSRNFELKEVPDLFLATTRWNCHQSFEGRVVHIVAREGVPLLYVKELPRSAPP